jgi:phosphoglycerol transferase MdoB-like AlkP superfamily enzyme
MRYVDEAVAQLFGALERSGLLDRTLVVIYGDHDSKLKLKRSEARRARDALSLDEKTVGFIAQRDWVTKKIPLFFVFPKKARAGIVERVGGQIDIGATILHYVGIPVPGSFFGRPLVGNGGGLTAQFAGAAAGEDMLWRPNASGGDCLDGAGIPRPKDACSDLRKKAGEEVELSLLVTTHDLAERLSETVSGVRRSAEVLR